MTLVSGIPKEFLSLYFIVTSRSAPGSISSFELFSEHNSLITGQINLIEQKINILKAYLQLNQL